MSDRARSVSHAVMVLGCGAAATFGYAYWTDASSLMGDAILFAPYVLLALVAPNVRLAVTLTTLGIEVALTAFFWWVAASDAQGALAILWVSPLQITFA